MINVEDAAIEMALFFPACNAIVRSLGVEEQILAKKLRMIERHGGAPGGSGSIGAAGEIEMHATAAATQAGCSRALAIDSRSD